MQQQAMRNRTATGGLGMGGDSAQMARQLAQTQATSSRDALLGLNEQQTKNRISGLGGLLDTAKGVADSRSGAVRDLGSLESNVSQGRLMGQGQESTLLNQRGALEGEIATGRREGTAGLGRLYDTSSSRGLGYGNLANENFGTGLSGMGDASKIMAELSKNPGLLNSILQGVGGVAGGLGGLLGGI